jgi:sulfur carrier protein ThiS
MRKRSYILAALLQAIATTLVVPSLWGGEALDRVVAVVNGHAVLQSDWDDEVRYECFMSARPLRDVTADDRKRALGRLIDQELLREQMRSDFKPAGEDEVDKQLEALEADYAPNHESQTWTDALANYGITQGIVKDRVALELNQLRLVDARLRPTIQIDAAAVEKYYKEQVLPKFPPGQQMSLKEAEPRIREVLVQQKMNDLLDSWLESLRSQARIQNFADENSRLVEQAK